MMSNIIREKIIQAAEWASLAPSSHNCQPWSLMSCSYQFYTTYIDDQNNGSSSWSDALILGIDHAKRLSALLGIDREMRISVGAFATLFYNFLQLQGIKTAYFLIPDKWKPISAFGVDKLSDCEPLIVFFVGDQTIPENPDALIQLLHLVKRRVTLRAPYSIQSNHNISTDFARVLPYRLQQDQSLQWRKVNDKELVKRVAKFVTDNAQLDFTHRKAWKETYRYIDFSSRTGDIEDAGFNIQQLMGPLPKWKREFYRWILSPNLMLIFRYLGTCRHMAKQLGGLVIQSQALCYLHSSIETSDNRKQLELFAGESIMEFWLAGTANNLVLHPISVVLQHAEVRQKLASVLEESNEILFFTRLGQASGASEIYFRYRQPVKCFLK